MSTAQTRRSVSITGDLYQALRSYCQKADRSMSDLVEENMRSVVSMPQRNAASRAVASPTISPNTPESVGLDLASDKPWKRAGYATRSEWRAAKKSSKVVEKKENSLSFPAKKPAPRPAPLSLPKPKPTATKPAQAAPPAPIQKTDPARFEEWAKAQPRAKVDPGPKRIPTSNVVLF